MGRGSRRAQRCGAKTREWRDEHVDDSQIGSCIQKDCDFSYLIQCLIIKTRFHHVHHRIPCRDSYRCGRIRLITLLDAAHDDANSSLVPQCFKAFLHTGCPGVSGYSDSGMMLDGHGGSMCGTFKQFLGLQTLQTLMIGGSVSAAWRFRPRETPRVSSTVTSDSSKQRCSKRLHQGPGMLHRQVP